MHKKATYVAHILWNCCLHPLLAAKHQPTLVFRGLGVGSRKNIVVARINATVLQNILFTANSSVLMDDGEFKSTCYQRVYQYITCHETEPEDLDDFVFNSENIEDSSQNCLELLLR